MIDESLLDAPEALTRADTGGLLRGAAESGARVRTAVRAAYDSGITELRPEGRPRFVLVAGYGTATVCVADLLGAFGNGGVPVSLLRPHGVAASPDALRWALPGWAGPLDLLLITTDRGDEPGLAALVDQAYRRGSTVVAVAPPRSELAEALGGSRGLMIPLAPGTYPASSYAAVPGAPSTGNGTGPDAAEVGRALAAPGTLWALIPPLLALADRLGLVHAPRPALDGLADRLDEVSERCGPAVDTYINPGKTLAAELSGALPLLWSEGEIAAAAARHCTVTLATLAGRPSLAAGLPEALGAHRALLADRFARSGEGDDFFRDRVEEPETLHTRVILLREQPPGGESAVVAARELAYAHDTPLSEIEPVEGSGPLQAAAELIATLHFAAVYLTLAVGEPS